MCALDTKLSQIEGTNDDWRKPSAHHSAHFVGDSGSTACVILGVPHIKVQMHSYECEPGR